MSYLIPPRRTDKADVAAFVESVKRVKDKADADEIATLTAKLETAEKDNKLLESINGQRWNKILEQSAKINVLEQSLADSGASKLYGDQLFDVWKLNQGLTEQVEQVEIQRDNYFAICVERAQTIQQQTDQIEALKVDAERLDYLESLTEAYGFQNEHLGNRWHVEGAFSTLRKLIDFDLAAREVKS